MNGQLNIFYTERTKKANRPLTHQQVHDRMRLKELCTGCMKYKTGFGLKFTTQELLEGQCAFCSTFHDVDFKCEGYWIVKGRPVVEKEKKTERKQKQKKTVNYKRTELETRNSFENLAIDEVDYAETFEDKTDAEYWQEYRHNIKRLKAETQERLALFRFLPFFASRRMTHANYVRCKVNDQFAQIKLRHLQIGSPYDTTGFRRCKEDEIPTQVVTRLPHMEAPLTGDFLINDDKEILWNSILASMKPVQIWNELQQLKLWDYFAEENYYLAMEIIMLKGAHKTIQGDFWAGWNKTSWYHYSKYLKDKPLTWQEELKPYIQENRLFYKEWDRCQDLTHNSELHGLDWTECGLKTSHGTCERSALPSTGKCVLHSFPRCGHCGEAYWVNRLRQHTGFERKEKDQKFFVKKEKKYTGTAQGMFDFAKLEGPLNKIANNMTNVSVNHNVNFPLLKELADKMPVTGVNWMLILREFSFMLAHIYQGNMSVASIMTSFAHFLCNIPISQILVNSLTEFAYKLFNRNAQSDLGNHGLLISGLTLFSVVIASLSISKIPQSKDIDSFIMRLSKVGACINSLGKLKEVFGDMLGRCVDFIQEQYTGIKKENYDEFALMNQWCEKVEPLMKIDIEQEHSQNLSSQVNSLIKQGNQLAKEMETLKYPREIYSRYRTLYQYLLHLRDRLSGTGIGSHRPRIGATVVQLFGGTGVGKSMATHLLNARVLAALGYKDVKDLSNMVYFRDATQERFDGYTTDMQIVVMDDFGTVKDSTAKPSAEPNQIIKGSNSAVWALPQASLADKGRIFFEAKLMLLTSNHATYTWDSITNPFAVDRRVELKYEICVKPEYCKPNSTQLDTDKINALAEEDEDIFTKVWTIHSVNTTVDNKTANLTYLAKDLDFDTMCRQIIERINSNQNKGHKHMDYISKYFSKHAQNAQMDNYETHDFYLNPALVKSIGTPTDYNDMPVNKMDDWLHWLSGSKTISQKKLLFESNACEFNIEEFERAREANIIKVNSEFSKAFVATGFKIKYSQFDQFCSSYLAAFSHCYDKFGPSIFMNKYNAALLGERFIYFEQVMSFLMPEASFSCSHTGIFTLPSFFNIIKIKLSQIAYKLVQKTFDFMKWYTTIDLWLPLKVFCTTTLCFVLTYAIGAWAVENDHDWLTKLIFADGKKYVEKKNRLNNSQARKDKCLRKPACKAQDEMCDKCLEWHWYQDCEYMLGNFEHYCEEVVRIVGKTKEHVCDIFTGLCYNCKIRFKITGIGFLETEDPEIFCNNLENLYVPMAQALGYMDKYTNQIKETTERLHYVNGYRPNCGYKCEELHYESAQDRTSGSSRKNVESYQDKTNGSIKKNVESCNDVNAKEIESKIERNLYRIEIVENGNRYSLGSVCFITGRIAITNKHIVDYINGRTFEIKNHNFPSGFEIPSGTYKSFSNNNKIHGYKDVSFIVFPRNIHCHPSIIKHFQTKEDFAYSRTFFQYSITKIDKVHKISTYYGKNIEAFDREFELVDGESVKLVRDFFRYDAATTVGDCGAVVVVHDIAAARKIIGIHMAGCNDGIYTGVAVAVHQEFLREALNSNEISHLDMTPNDVVLPKNVQMEKPFPGEYTLHGEVPYVYQPTESNIVPSVLHNKIAKSTMKPAYLKRTVNESGIAIDPLSLARSKAFSPSIALDNEILERCKNDYEQILFKKVDPFDMDVLTVEESIAGIPGEDYYDGIKRNTSPGYGWDKSGKGKTKWLGTDEYITDNAELRLKLAEYMDNIRNDKRTGTIWTDTLKDERRKIEKVEQGKTRLFAAGEMAYLVLFRQYFMGFAAHMMRNRIAVESCVGINVYSREWTELAFRLLAKGNNIVAGDFSNYDGTLQSHLLWACLEVIEDFYQGTAEERHVRKMLWLDIVQSLHVTEHNGHSFLYEWNHSQPSGCPITAILNSLYHSLAARYIYILVARKYCPEKVSLKFFYQYVRHNNFGDDDLYSISSEIVDWYNQETMTEMFSQIGMTYTDEAKTGTIVKFRRLEEVAFLKRSFVWNESQMVFRSPLSLETILEMPQWVKGKLNHTEILRQTFEEAVYELAHHKQQTFEEFIQTFKKHLHYVDGARIQTYGEYQEHHYHTYVNKTSKEAQIGASDKLSSVASSKSCSPILVDSNTNKPAELFSSIDECVAGPSITQQKATHPTCNVGLHNAGPAQSNSVAQIEQENTTQTQGTLNEPIIQHDREQIMTFAEEGPIAREEIHSTIPNSLSQDASEALIHSVIGFLKRPVEVTNFDWPSTAVSNTELAAIDLPRDWLQNAMVKNKVDGFRYLRCDIKIRVQVNAQQFNAGRLLLVFFPLYSQNAYNPSSTYHLGGITGYPRVDLDLASSTSAEITIPFSTVVTHFDLSNGTGTLGRFSLRVYSPLTGLSDVDGTIWMHADNIDIQLPTPIKYTLTGYAQMDKEKQRPGNIETISKSVGSIARKAAALPLLGSVASTVGAVADLSSGIASIFGWSKPTDPEFPTTVNTGFGKHMTNFNGDSKVKSLALDARNMVTLNDNAFNTSEDEMAIQTILSKPVFADRFTVSKTDVPKAIVWKWENKPTACTQIQVSPWFEYFHTRLSYNAIMWKYWRGGIKYHFKPVKTPFHSLRLRLSFVPGATADTDLTAVNLDYCYSKVIDLRETNEFDVTIPYLANSPWRSTYSQSNSTSGLPTGMLVMTVVNSLRNPSTCADNIEILVEVSAAEDFQFAFPSCSLEHKILASNEVQPSSFSGNVQMDSEFIPSQKPPLTDPIQQGIGEAAVSYRQVLKRYMPISNGNPISPYVGGVNVSSPSESSLTNQTPTLRDFIANQFRFQTGSYRVAVVMKQPTVTSCTLENDQAIGSIVGTKPTNIQVSNLEQFAEFGVPFYQRWPMIPTDLGYPIVNNGDTMIAGGSFHTLPYNTGTQLNFADASQFYQVYTSNGEDFSYGFLLGPPLTAINYS